MTIIQRDIATKLKINKTYKKKNNVKSIAHLSPLPIIYEYVKKRLAEVNLG